MVNKTGALATFVQYNKFHRTKFNYTLVNIPDVIYQ